MFQFRRFPSYTYLIQCRMTGYCPAGLPHSEISGSMDICSSPKLIAACHVLHRLLMPRHSPCALFSLTNRKLAFARSRCELCRLSQRFEIVIVTLHLSRCCSTIKITLPVLFSTETSLLPYFTLLYIVQFSRYDRFPASFEARLKHSTFECFNPISNGGDSRDRTGDLLLARQALSQLSYIPSSRRAKLRFCGWWARVGSNHRPCDYQSHALAS